MGNGFDNLMNSITKLFEYEFLLQSILGENQRASTKIQNWKNIIFLYCRHAAVKVINGMYWSLYYLEGLEELNAK
jgi:hypothetical protein